MIFWIIQFWCKGLWIHLHCKDYGWVHVVCCYLFAMVPDSRINSWESGFIFILLGAPREYILHGLDPGLDWASCWSPFPSVFLVCPGPTSILLFAPTDRISHLTPSLLSGRLLTNVQVNNITMLHDTYGHTNIHHIGITILLLFYTSSTLLGRPTGPGPSRLTQLCWNKDRREGGQ